VEPKPIKIKIRTVGLIKGNQWFCFRFEEGEEEKIFETLIDLLQRGDSILTLEDGAQIANGIGPTQGRTFKEHFMPKPHKA
jgi:hypothetical protein